jgi:two-component system, sensor histidine kinase and response regulator
MKDPDRDVERRRTNNIVSVDRPKRSEDLEKLITILRHTPFGVALLDPNEDPLFINEEFTRITGYRPKDVPNAKSWYEQAYPDPVTRKNNQEKWTALKASKNDSAIGSICCRDGSIKYVEFRFSRISDERSIVVFNDVSMRVAAEKESRRLTENLEELVCERTRNLRESEQTALALINATEDIAVLITKDGRILAINEATANRMGSTSDDLIETSVYDRFSPEVSQARRKMVDEAIRTKRPVRFLDDLRDREYESNICPIVDDTGEVNRIAILAHDVTRQRKVEKELRLSLDKAQESDLQKGRFMATMSHEFRTPLNAIIGLADLLVSAPDLGDLQKRNYQELIRQHGRSLLMRVDSILESAKIQYGSVVPRSLVFTPTTLIDRLCQMYDAIAGTRGLTFFCDKAPDLPESLLGDPMLIERALCSILENAIKFTDEGSVELHTRVESVWDGGAGLHFEVRDTGPGIPADQLHRIFESFYQLDSSSTRRHGGTGLGLAIAKDLVEMMGGKIWAEPRGCGGTAFHILLDFAFQSESNGD